MSQSDTCPKCSKPKVQSTHGSITQWMSSCSCDLVDSTTPAGTATNTTTLCKACGKRIDAGRAGSLTQWIFRSDKCECEVPEPTEVNVLPGVPEVEEEAESGVDESGIELDPSVFPTDRYQALREIGTGAAGQVFLCKDKLLKTKVALKCLRHLSSEQLISFQQEARATSKLSHPGIVKVLNFGITDGGAPYMVMDFIDGISLEGFLLRSGPLEAAAAMSIVAQTADALAYAHSKGILHRDIKSSNILIEGDRACLIDFGIAMVKQAHQQPTVVQGRTVVGTPSYMPPDQANGLTYDERSEIYSLGCVLFEALAGEPPFAGETALEIISKHATQIAPQVSDVNPDTDCTDEIESILARCLAKLPDNRFKNMSELRDACDSAGAPSPELGDAEESTDEQKRNGRAPVSMLEPEKKSSDIRGAFAAIAAVVGLAIASIWFVVSHQTPEQSHPVRLLSNDNELVMTRNRGQAIKSMIKSGATDFRLGVLWPECKEDDLAVFDGSKTATIIDCTDMDIGDKALKHFSGLPLKRLVLSGTSVKTLEYIPGEKTLLNLHVDGTRINDAALRRLSKFEQLEVALLGTNNITAGGIIEAMRNLPLQELGVENCPEISETDVQKLRLAFPFARINRRNSVVTDCEIKSAWYANAGQVQNAFDSWKKLREDSTTHPDPRKRLAVLSLCNMAKYAIQLHKMKPAKNYLDEAQEISAQTEFPVNLRVTREALFDYYTFNKDLDSAIEVGMKALKFDEERKGVMQMDLAYRVGECLISKKRYDEALEPLEKTERIRFDWVAQVAERAKRGGDAGRELNISQMDLIYHELRLAHCYVALHRCDDSMAKSNSALRVVRENAVRDPIVLADVFMMKAHGEAECKKFQDALESNEQALKATSSSQTSRAKEQHKDALKQRQAILMSQKQSGG